jgi:hypothetical protein
VSTAARHLGKRRSELSNPGSSSRTPEFELARWPGRSAFTVSELGAFIAQHNRRLSSWHAADLIPRKPNRLP